MDQKQSSEIIEVQVGPASLPGVLGIPERPTGIVLFAHGSGSGRYSPRNNRVAEALRESGLATLLIDLLTPEEEVDRANVFDIRLLASRLLQATDWVGQQDVTRDLAIGYFGASTGAAAALVAAAERGPEIAAVVSRGGRVDLAKDVLLQVSAPTLLIVGGDDSEVVRLNEHARPMLRGLGELVIVPGAGHLFEEPGTLDEALDHARRWFITHFRKVRTGGLQR